MTLPKLHIRDLIWLVLVCALVLGWWNDRRALTHQHRKEIELAYSKGVLATARSQFRALVKADVQRASDDKARLNSKREVNVAEGPPAVDLDFPFVWDKDGNATYTRPMTGE